MGTLQAERGRMTTKAVTRKLEAVRTALTRVPLDIGEANPRAARGG